MDKLLTVNRNSRYVANNVFIHDRKQRSSSETQGTFDELPLLATRVDKYTTAWDKVSTHTYPAAP